MKLSEMTCVPPRAADPALAAAAAAARLAEVPAWSLDDQALTRDFKFKNFREAMAFANAVADVAEGQGHHPDIAIAYNRVRLTLTTHKIGGLSLNDFIVAARIDLLPAAAAAA